MLLRVSVSTDSFRKKDIKHTHTLHRLHKQGSPVAPWTMHKLYVYKVMDVVFKVQCSCGYKFLWKLVLPSRFCTNHRHCKLLTVDWCFFVQGIGRFLYRICWYFGLTLKLILKNMSMSCFCVPHTACTKIRSVQSHHQYHQNTHGRSLT